MNTVTRRFPWSSVMILFAGYIALGRFLAENADPLISLGMGFLVAFLLSIAFMHPLTFLGKLIRRRFESDAVAFCSLVLFAAFISILLNWFKLFLPIFMILSCEALARIDFTHGGFREKTTYFWMLSTSWFGLGIGWAIGVWELWKWAPIVQQVFGS
jgi:hypothetical protein